MAERKVFFRRVRRSYDSDLPLVLHEHEDIVHVATFCDTRRPGDTSGVDVVIAKVKNIDGDVR